MKTSNLESSLDRDRDRDGACFLLERSESNRLPLSPTALLLSSLFCMYYELELQLQLDVQLK
jgi:hypothetical protein